MHHINYIGTFTNNTNMIFLSCFPGLHDIETTIIDNICVDFNSNTVYSNLCSYVLVLL